MNANEQTQHDQNQNLNFWEGPDSMAGSDFFSNENEEFDFLSEGEDCTKNMFDPDQTVLMDMPDMITELPSECGDPSSKNSTKEVKSAPIEEDDPYDYEPKNGQLFTEKLTPVANYSKTNKKSYGTFPQSPEGKMRENVFMRKPLTDFHRVLNYEDFHDVDEYLQLADRPVETRNELIKNPNYPPKYTGYDYPKEPIEFIGRLEEFQYRDCKNGKGRVYCFTTLGLEKLKLIAFRKPSGIYSPSYQIFDLNHTEIGTWMYCKAVRSTKTNRITWALTRELKEPSLKDIFQNPDPKFRPKGWHILNDKIIFDPTLIQGNQLEDIEGFKVVAEPGKTKKFFGSLEGMLG